MAICELDHLALLPRRQYVLVGGCFDPLHEGHLSHLWEARKHGPLVCAVASDATVARKRPPLLPALVRRDILNNLRVLDHVYLAADGIAPVLEALQPSAYVTGPDWIGRLPAEQVSACERLNIPIRHTNGTVETPRSATAYLDGYQRRLNAEKLAAFEAWVTTQPTPEPWTPVTDYSFEARQVVEAPHADRIREVLQPTRVLDVGCGPGHLVTMLTAMHVEARGVDLPDFDVRWQAYEWTKVYYADVVICREVLEHLRAAEIVTAVRHLVALSSRLVYVTTRFATGAHLLDFDQRDDLDPTHVTMLSQDYLRSLFVLQGCRRRADLESRMDWKHLGRVLVYEVPL